MPGIDTSLDKKLSDMRVVVASRFRTSVPVMNLADFLRSRVAELTLIRHPFPFNKAEGSSVVRWKRGDEQETCRASYRAGMGDGWFQCISFVRTIWWMLGRPRMDLYIGLGALEALAGVVLRILGKTRLVVFYSIDFVPRRFQNNVVNSFFNRIYNRFSDFSFSPFLVSFQIFKIILQAVYKLHPKLFRDKPAFLYNSQDFSHILL